MAYRAVYFLVLACLSCTAAQLADNLIVSGSNRPFAEGVGTYGLPKRGEGGLVSDKMPSVLVTDRASGALFSNGSGNVTRYNSTADALAALASFLGSDVSRQLSGGRRLAQQPAAKLNTSDIVTTGLSAARQYFAEDNALQHKKGGLPTVSTQDGNFQIISNNDSGNEFQVAKDGTITIVNGGLSPGIFSIGPNGVTLNKDNALGPIQAMSKAIARVADGGTDAGGGDAGSAGAVAPSAGAGGAVEGAASSLPGSQQATVSSGVGRAAPALASGVNGADPAMGSLPSPVSAAAAPQYTPALGVVPQAGSGGQAAAAGNGQPGMAAATGTQGLPQAGAYAGTQSTAALEAALGAMAAALRSSTGTAVAQPVLATGPKGLRTVTYSAGAALAPSPAGSSGAGPNIVNAPSAGRRLRMGQ